MTYGICITFPVEPTKEDIKKIKRDLAYDKFEVIDGGKEKCKPTAKYATGKNKTKPASDKT